MKKTIAYVDGFNLFYGALKGTKYKWLNLHKAISTRLGTDFNLVSLKYFTAKVKPTAKDADIHKRQHAYIRALKSTQLNFSVTFGKYKERILTRPIAPINEWPKEYPISQDDYSKLPPYVTISSREEKGSDVNLAIQIVRDSAVNECDCICLVSNDSDMSGALKIAKNEFGKQIVLMTPWKYRKSTPHELKQHTNLVKVLNEKTLAASQLPDSIPNTPITKPLQW